MKNILIIILAGFIFLITGLAWGDVGEQSQGVTVYQWYLPVEVFVLLSVPAILGYLIGRKKD